MMEMGKEIRRLREERGITQEALNVTAQSVSKWERGFPFPPPRRIELPV